MTNERLTELRKAYCERDARNMATLSLIRCAGAAYTKHSEVFEEVHVLAALDPRLGRRVI